MWGLILLACLGFYFLIYGVASIMQLSTLLNSKSAYRRYGSTLAIYIFLLLLGVLCIRPLVIAPL